MARMEGGQQIRTRSCRLLINGSAASTDAGCGFVVAEGLPTTIGLEVEDDDDLRAQMTSLSLNVILKHYQDSIFHEVFSIGSDLDSATMTTAATGKLLFSFTKVFQVSEFRQGALELCIGLVQQHRDPAPQKEECDDEVSIRRLIAGQAPPRTRVVQEASATIRIGSFARLSSRSYELTPFSSLLAITVHNMHPSESLAVLSCSIHFRETAQAQVLGQDVSDMIDNASSDLNDRFSATSSVVDVSDLQELVETCATTNYVEKVAADALYHFTPIAPCNDEPIVVRANESFTLAYMARVRGADEAQQDQQSNRTLLEALGDFSTPVTVRWSVAKLPPQLAKHHVQWSVGSSSLTTQSSGSPLDISLSAPSHAVCNKEFNVTVRVTNTSARTASDLCLVTSDDSKLLHQQQQQQQRYICFQVTMPLKELAPGESTQVNLTILPVRAGHLQLSHIHIVYQGAKTYPRLSTTVVVTC